MPKKPKFKPVITRVKLNPEQAVLYCDCYTSGKSFWADSSGIPITWCWYDAGKHTGLAENCVEHLSSTSS